MWFERNVMYSVCRPPIYDLSVLAVSRMGFQKKKYLDRGVGGWVELYPIFFWIIGIFFNFAKPLSSVASTLYILWLHDTQ